MAFEQEYLKRVQQQPSLSPCHNYIAAITLEQTLRVFGTKRGRVVYEAQFSPALASIAADASFLNWAPDIETSNDEDLTSDSHIRFAWVLLGGDNRLVVVQLRLSDSGQPILEPALVVADHQFEAQHGKIVVAEFIFNHEQALIMFEMNLHASIVYFDKPLRNDIPGLKTSSHSSFAISAKNDYFALLTRSKGQDQIEVFTQKDGTIKCSAAFQCETLDARSIKWSPRQDPLLLVWDSTSYGPRIAFFTALGHALNAFDIEPHTWAASSDILEFPHIGVTSLAWAVASENCSILAAAIGGPTLLLREQNHKTLNIMSRKIYSHDRIIDGKQINIWQQTSKQEFVKQDGVFEINISDMSEIEAVSINADATMVAAKIDSVPKMLFLWDAHMHSRNSRPVSVVSFNHDVRTLAWHPNLPNALAITTRQEISCIYSIGDQTGRPMRVSLQRMDTSSLRRLGLKWINQPNSHRCPLVVSSKGWFDIGLLSNSGEKVAFDSLLGMDIDVGDEGDNTSFVYTPSKSTRLSRPVSAWPLDGVTGVWNADTSAEAW